jgi:hypothetical protein
VDSNHGELSLGLEDNFDAILITCLISFLKREIMFSLGEGKKEEKENENLVIVLEGWDSREISETLSSFIA